MEISEERLVLPGSVGLSPSCRDLLEYLMEGAFPSSVLPDGDPLMIADREGCSVLVMSSLETQVFDTAFWTDLKKRPDPLQVIVVVKEEDVAAAVRFMRMGACDVLVKPLDPGRLIKSINYALAMYKENRMSSQDENEHPATTSELIGISPEIEQVRRTIAAIAPSDASVFVWGESGTGKELVARAIHSNSRRAQRPFIAINCAALPKDILENELFGHERGAFTGALNQKQGCFEMANGGTLFLDEIGEMSSATQAKLLRVLESQTFRRLGGKAEIKVDVRIISATNRALTDALEEGTLRGDLYYRLSVVEMELPPLRDRRDDIVPLARHFLALFSFKYRKDIKGFSSEYIDTLQSYDWPGNVRELRNTIERAVVICPGDVISLHDLPAKIAKTQREILHINIPIGSTVEEAEKKLILETLASVNGNKAKAARMLGVSRKTLHNKLNSFKWYEDRDAGGVYQKTAADTM